METIEASSFLQNLHPLLKGVQRILSKQVDYISLLASDSHGLNYSVDNQSATISESPWVDRGVVCRIQHEGSIWEYSFNLYPKEANELAQQIMDIWQRRPSEGSRVYGSLEDKPCNDSWFSQVEQNPLKEDSAVVMKELQRLKEEALKTLPHAVVVQLRYQAVEVQKIFISNNRDLAQGYLWSEGYIIPQFRRGEQTRQLLKSFSGLCGSELLTQFPGALEKMAKLAEPLLDAGTIKPGEYEVLLSPSVAGILAHEAFGHGVESDTVMKGRALAGDYLDKSVASSKVEMHDGAKGQYHMSSYSFDDEGNIGGDLTIIKEGILKGYMGDELSLKALGFNATGNGRRESYKRKAYGRMTNTWFAPGEDSFDEMLKSIKEGYLIDSYFSGMEDPKNWGIQIAALYAHEIKDGALTGRLVAPVMMTGFLPRVLNSISMVSKDLKLEGSGACGKGYKEYVKVSSGGPYLKCKMRLG
ncbi:MAG: TldD/PmbA family protein [Spirochaetaceae bacterium]|jgi:TldD protein|nr:TldD/PmbA family protein [Spirochaetaceae bacterium]